jgi:hypothetical protein
MKLIDYETLNEYELIDWSKPVGLFVTRKYMTDTEAHDLNRSFRMSRITLRYVLAEIRDVDSSAASNRL